MAVGAPGPATTAPTAIAVRAGIDAYARQPIGFVRLSSQPWWGSHAQGDFTSGCARILVLRDGRCGPGTSTGRTAASAGRSALHRHISGGDANSNIRGREARAPVSRRYTARARQPACGGAAAYRLITPVRSPRGLDGSRQRRYPWQGPHDRPV